MEANALPEEIQEQLSLLNRSQKLLMPIFLGLLMQYKAIDIQRMLLLEGEGTEACSVQTCPDPKQIQLSSSLMILSSLLGFQSQTEQINRQTAEAGICPDTTDASLGMIVILVALLRFIRLLGSTETEENALAEEETEDLETI